MTEISAIVLVFHGVEVQVPAGVAFEYDGAGNLVLDFEKGYSGKLHLKQCKPTAIQICTASLIFSKQTYYQGQARRLYNR